MPQLTARSLLLPALVAVFGAVIMVSFHPLIGIPVAATALGALTYRGHIAVAVGVSVLGGIVAAALAEATMYVVAVPLFGVPTTARAPYVFAVMIALSLLMAGPMAAIALKRVRPFNVVGLVTLGLTAVQSAALASFAAGAGIGFGTYAITALENVAVQAGLGAEAGAEIAVMWPGVLLATNGLAAMIALVGVGVVGARLGVPLRRIPTLATLDLDPRLVLVLISAVALIAAGRLPIEAASVVRVVGENLLVVARWLFFLQGIAVFAGLVERLKLSRGMRMLGFVLLGAAEAFLPLVSLLGLADIWLNVRRLPRDMSSPPDAAQGVD